LTLLYQRSQPILILSLFGKDCFPFQALSNERRKDPASSFPTFLAFPCGSFRFHKPFPFTNFKPLVSLGLPFTIQAYLSQPPLKIFPVLMSFLLKSHPLSILGIPQANDSPLLSVSA